MSKHFSIRLEKSLMSRIDGYARSKEMKRSEAIRSLVELGLAVNDIRKDKSSDMDEEFKKLSIDTFIKIGQLFQGMIKQVPFCKISHLGYN